jgi:hypothetical protein
VHVALVNDGTKSGVHVISAPGPSYRARTRDEALDYLALGVFSGAGPHAFFMQTWSAGLAYSNGLRPSLASGRVRYYAERCPDLGATIRFVAGLARDTRLADRFLIEYSLASDFSPYRGAGGSARRGAALAADLVDGITPQVVRACKTLLLGTAREKGTLDAVRKRLPDVLGRVLVGFGPPVARTPGAVAFVIGPEDLLARYELHLRETREADRLVRLYPRDFWPRPPPE